MSRVREGIDALLDEHGDEIAAGVLAILPRLIAMVKRGRQKQIVAALDRAHASVDAAADAARAELRRGGEKP